MLNPSGRYFDSSVYVEIDVVGSGTPVAGATATPTQSSGGSGGTIRAVADIFADAGSTIKGVFCVIGLPFLRFRRTLGEIPVTTLIDYHGSSESTLSALPEVVNRCWANNWQICLSSRS